MFKGGHRFAVTFQEAFAAGCVMGADGVIPVKDFDKKGQGDDQDRDKRTGERVWAVRVHDLDPELAGKSREVVVKITAPVQPVPPSGPFTPVEFEGLTVTPWIDDKSGRMKYSLRATGFREADKSGRLGKAAAA